MSENQKFYEKVGSENKSKQKLTPTTVDDYPDDPNTDIDDNNRTGHKRWASSHSLFWGATQTYDELPAGLYTCQSADSIGPAVSLVKVATDHLIELPDEDIRSIVSEFVKFWELKKDFEDRGFLHKRGILLWGPPGSGKTSAIQILIQRLVKDHEGIVLFAQHPGVLEGCLHLVREIEETRPLIVVLEDIDALVERHGESQYLALLDGEAQINNVVFLATTNYPERLDRRFVDRPSRFDTIKYIGMPTAEAREVYLKTKEPSLEGDELDKWVEMSEDYSVAHLKEMIIANRCFKHPIEKVVERLNETREKRPNSEEAPIPGKASLGFAS